MDRPRRATIVALAAAASASLAGGAVCWTAGVRGGPDVVLAADACDYPGYPPRLLDSPEDALPIALFAPQGEGLQEPPLQAEHSSQPVQWQSAGWSQLQRLPVVRGASEIPRMAALPRDEQKPTPKSFAIPHTPVKRDAWRMADAIETAPPAPPPPQPGQDEEKPVRSVLAPPAAASPTLDTSPIEPPMFSTTGRTPDGEQRFQAVEHRAAADVREAFSLAERGAHFTARSRLIATLRLLAQSLDAAEGTRTHSESVSAAFRALAEAEDFQPSAGRVETTLDLKHLVRAHRTPVLRDADLERLTPLEALQRYYAFAQDRLAASVGGRRAGSLTLYALGKLHGASLVVGAGDALADGPKAMVFYQAAVLSDPENHLAANELGVLLAKYEQWSDARRALLHSLKIHPTPETWHNLAVVHERLGEHDLAAKARYEMAQVAGPTPSLATGGPRVQWLAPSEFAGMGDGAAPPRIQQPTPASAQRPKDAAWWKPWSWF